MKNSLKFLLPLKKWRKILSLFFFLVTLTLSLINRNFTFTLPATFNYSHLFRIKMSLLNWPQKGQKRGTGLNKNLAQMIKHRGGCFKEQFFSFCSLGQWEQEYIAMEINTMVANTNNAGYIILQAHSLNYVTDTDSRDSCLVTPPVHFEEHLLTAVFKELQFMQSKKIHYF